MNAMRIATWSTLADREPSHALVHNVDLVVIRYDDEVSVLFGRCLHRGALMSDGKIIGDDIVCGVHGWDYRFESGISAYNPSEVLHKFKAWVEDDAVWVDADEVIAFHRNQPQRFDRSRYLGEYADFHGTDAEPHNAWIEELARNGLRKVGHHGKVSAMGVHRDELPSWDDLQILTAQLARRPLFDEDDVDTTFVIGPQTRRPLEMARPIFVSDMSYGSLSAESKVALARGANQAGTGICSGEGGMLDDEQAENERYLYELASGRFGWSLDKVKRVQAFHFKSGQGAKTGLGGHLPGHKVTGRIAETRGLPEGQSAVSPATFRDLITTADYARVADEVREVSGGIPIGFKLSAQHVELDIDFALAAGADYIILDGRGGGTGAAPDVIKQHIGMPTMAGIARARRHLDRRGRRDVTLIATGGLRTETDFVKAMALGADGVAIANSAMQAIGCLGMRACHTDNCPVGIATQREDLRRRFEIAKSAKRLQTYLEATTELMTVLARACGHRRLADFSLDDLTTWKREVAALTGVSYAGVG